jgi:hypothetical protein
MTAVSNAKKSDQVYAIKVGERVVLPFEGAPLVVGKDRP